MDMCRHKHDAVLKCSSHCVLILVIMDMCRHGRYGHKFFAKNVLILVIMDMCRHNSSPSALISKKGLNPCYNGYVPAHLVCAREATYTTSLNPCYNGYVPAHSDGTKEYPVQHVLILVIMDMCRHSVCFPCLPVRNTS